MFLNLSVSCQIRQGQTDVRFTSTFLKSGGKFSLTWFTDVLISIARVLC